MLSEKLTDEFIGKPLGVESGEDIIQKPSVLIRYFFGGYIVDQNEINIRWVRLVWDVAAADH